MTVVFIISMSMFLSYLSAVFYKRLRQAGVVRSEPHYLGWVIFVIVALWLLFAAWNHILKPANYRTIEREPGHWEVIEE